MQQQLFPSVGRGQFPAGRAYTAGGNARQTAFEIIRDKIINLDFKPGEALSDKQLAEELNMSRTPVREALIILSTSNMVLLKPQIGTFVAPIDVERMEMEQFARYTMEKEIVSLACTHMTDELKWRYEENLRAYRHYSESDAPDRGRRLMELDNSFHRIAFTAAGKENHYLHMISGMQHIERMRVLSVMGMSQEQTWQDHQQISGAIIAGELERALLWLDRHLNRYQENLRAIQTLYPEYFAVG